MANKKISFGIIATKRWTISLVNQALKKLWQRELTAEHKTGETFNGKDVYEKVVETTTPSSSGTALIGNLTNMDSLIEVTGSFVSSSGANIPINIFQDSSTYNYIYITSAGGITMEIKNSSHFKRPLKLKLKYTKK